MTKSGAEQAADEIERLRAERDELAKALDTIHSWLVCAAIASAEDMAQSFEAMEQIAAAALALAKDAEAQ